MRADVVATVDLRPRYLIHPAAELFPMMGETELADLAKNIEQNGLLHPVLRFEGQVIDGRNRLEACWRSGVKPSFRDIEIPGDPYAWVWATNAKRRMLDADQLATIYTTVLVRSGEWSRRQAELKAEADRARAEEQRGNRNAAKERKQSCQKPDTTVSTPPAKRRVSEQVASEIGVSRGKVEAAHKLAVEAPALAEQVARGEKSLNLATLEHEAPEMAAKVESGEVKSVAAARKLMAEAKAPPPPEPEPEPESDFDDDEPDAGEDDFDLDEEQHAELRALNPEPFEDEGIGSELSVDGGDVTLEDGEDAGDLVVVTVRFRARRSQAERLKLLSDLGDPPVADVITYAVEAEFTG